MIKNIILDFGHGGIDKNGNYTTAPSKMYTFSNGVVAFEGEINRQIGGLLALYLSTHRLRYNVVLTVNPYDATDISLDKRVEIANSFKKDETILISVHSNASSPSGTGTGFEIYTTTGQTKSDILATEIGNSVKTLYQKLNLKLRFNFTDGDLDQENNFFILRKSACPAVLLECLFFDNWNDYQKLRDPEFQKEMSWYIYKGIMSYLDKYGDV
ncbi:MAG: N-acetylmuramoyl-L-alanine amidase [Bacteroidota bacterium]|jgi:N-acetylmuramoyl-L-alanine amidase|nr:N-acetylmuramoyl-L-alanine amidase [Saprospiraceae bacterium]